MHIVSGRNASVMLSNRMEPLPSLKEGLFQDIGPSKVMCGVGQFAKAYF